MAIDVEFPRPADDAVAALSQFSTATVHEASGQNGALRSSIKPIYPGMKLCGPALTVECPPGDNLMIHAAIETARSGDVLVVDCRGYIEAGPFGDVLATACLVKGIRGLVIDGCVRDGESIRDLGFPVFARGRSVKGTTKKLIGSIGQAIVCAGVPTSLGDVVVGDDDGVVVVPASLLSATIEACRKRIEREAAMVEKIKGGASTMDLLNLRPALGDDH
jgi:4-hydroxy-4-methyl-2-oxoglutarate aldolase